MDAQRRPELRVGDAEREVTLERLRTAHAEGRLDVDEFYARMDTAYTARTFGDLDALVLDLPAAGVERFADPPRRPMQPGARVSSEATSTYSGGRLVGEMPAQLQRSWISWATAVSINIVVWALVSVLGHDWIYFWPAWVAGPWGVINLGTTVSWWLNRGQDGGRPEIGRS